MTVARTAESELYVHATKVAAELRAVVAEQLHAIVLEGTMAGSRGEMTARLQSVLAIERQIAEARGRQQQAREVGSPVQAHVMAELEGREMLRSAVMALGAACGSWVMAMDYEERRKVDGRLNGTTRAREKEEHDGEAGE